MLFDLLDAGTIESKKEVPDCDRGVRRAVLPARDRRFRVPAIMAASLKGKFGKQELIHQKIWLFTIPW